MQQCKVCGLNAGPFRAQRKICRPCERKQAKAWRAAHPTQVAAYNQAYNETHRDYYVQHARAWRASNRERHRAARKAWAKANPEKVLRMARVRKYGPEGGRLHDYMLAGGLCQACGARATDVDHCHTTGVARGALCGGCNSALGQVKDQVSRLEGLIVYLRSKDATAVYENGRLIPWSPPEERKAA